MVTKKEIFIPALPTISSTQHVTRPTKPNNCTEIFPHSLLLFASSYYYFFFIIVCIEICFFFILKTLLLFHSSISSCHAMVIDIFQDIILNSRFSILKRLLQIFLSYKCAHVHQEESKILIFLLSINFKTSYAFLISHKNRISRDLTRTNTVFFSACCLQMFLSTITAYFNENIHGRHHQLNSERERKNIKKQ